ncbi:MAG TPA: NADH-quinone oxidoreductase subunit NuoK [Armatimonadota bacterium]|jgi:NAD(P)H-quinone oxidoreductase subunit 4L
MGLLRLEFFLGVAALLFCTGLYGVLTRRNAVAVLMGVELMLNAANLNLVAFNRFVPSTTAAAGATPLAGQAFSIFVITVAVAEAAVGLAIIISLYRNFQHINVDDVNFLRW